ncbi:competence/damage-inducible protein A [Ruminococcaceae bacterium OttesenSCG-928-D13]|nr:competence/damage-inducible protein A [Ruminococcaceae bacterium OttesenSCG-928-D13]
MRAEIISVGTELLLGDILNTNAQFLAQQLAGLGFSVFYQTVVGDNPGRLRSVVNEAKARSDVLIFTGGLGPTADDLTKETIAEAFGDVLVMDEEELLNLQTFFEKRGVPMGDNNRKQAMVPLRGKKLPNPNGTAPGAYFRQNGKYAILLPGPPREMKPMFLNEAVPLLEGMQDAVIRSLTLRVFGIGESALEDKVIDLLDNANPTAALYAKTGEVHIRITARATTSEAADAMCEEYAVLFHRILGDMIYSDNMDDLETTAVRLLVDNGKTVATAESCTGGLLGERITSVPGSSAVFGYGAITYANDAKHKMLGVSNGTLRRYGAVSSQVAAEMAFGAARRRKDDYGIGITGIAGPDGGSVQKPVGLVYIAIACGRDVYVKKLSMSDRGREYVRELATQNALDMLRRIVRGLEIPGAKHFTRSQEADFERVGKPRGRGGPVLRAAVAFLVVAALLALVITGVWLAGRSGGEPAAAAIQTPSAQGLQYGTEAYTQAAAELVRQTREENSEISGFLALPGAEDGTVEALVARPANSAQQALAENLDDGGALGVIAQDATPAKTATNTLVLGTAALEPLWALEDTENAGAVSTFTYYTTNDAKTYQVFAVFVTEDEPPGGFDPQAENLAGYDAFLGFVLGGKARSLYDIPVAPEQTDSFMTLAATDPDGEGRLFYICGKLVQPGEEPPRVAASAASEPLMPAAWYTGQGKKVPDEKVVYNSWLRWYLTRDQSNSDLQLLMGMPTADAYPMVTPADTRPDPSELPEPESTPVSKSESAASSDSSGSGSGSESESGDSASSSGSESVVSSSDSSGSASGSESSTDSSSGGNSNAQPDSTSTSASGSDASDTSGSGSSEPESVSSAPSSSSSAVYVPPKPEPQKADPDTLTVTMNGQAVTGDVVDILAQICQAEVAGQDSTIIKALAIAAHSWIMNLQGAGVEAPPVVGRQPSVATRAAVAEVADLILSGDGTNPAFTPWYQMAAFGTNDAETAFGAYRSYLASAASPYEENMENWRQYLSFTAEEMAAVVERQLGLDLTLHGEPNTWFSGVTQNDSGYVESLKVGDVTVTGMDFWRDVLVEDGVPLLPSCAFEIDWSGESFQVITYGSGHGCGLSLSGAGGYVREGWDYERILGNYYPDAKLIHIS